MKRLLGLWTLSFGFVALPVLSGTPPAPPTHFRVSSPFITAQLQNQTVAAGQNATFSVSVTGDAPFSYRWTVSGLAVGSSSNSYTRLSCPLSDNGRLIAVTVSNATGLSATSRATLNVRASQTNWSTMQNAMLALLQNAQAGLTTNNWTFETSTGRVAGSWISGLDMSGYCLAGALGSANAFDCSLITPKHCVAAAHAWPIPGAIGMQLVFQGVDGLAYTNSIAAMDSLSNLDVLVLTLASNMPPAVHPFEILPPDWWNFASIGASNQYSWPTLWINNVTGNHADVTTIALCNGVYDGEINFEPDVPEQPAWVRTNTFFENVPLTGNPRSSAGVFAVLGTNHVAILTSIRYSDVSGPCYSATNILPWITSIVGPSPLILSDLSPWITTAP